MKKFIIFFCAGATLTGSAFAIDFNPRQVEVDRNGPPLHKYFFREGETRLVFRVDSNMSVSGGSTAAAFRFTDLKNSSMKLATSPLTPQTPFDEKNLELYRNAARAMLPAEATEVKIEEEKANPIVINGWSSEQFIFSYKMFGFPYQRSVTFINYSPTEQWTFDVLSPTGDYGKTYGRSYQVLNSLSDAPSAQGDGPT